MRSITLIEGVALLALVPACLSAQTPAPTPGGPPVHNIYSPQIIDAGVPGLLKQFIDVNGDGWVDYCRFVGNVPNLYLSCQLGTGNFKLSKKPYGYNSAPGVQLGSAPSGLFDRGGNGLHFVEYCRYLNVPIKSGARSPNVAPLTTKKVSCLEPGKTGFTSIEDDPSSKSNTFDLMRAPDGTLIEYQTRLDGSWSAEGRDIHGIKWGLQGGSSQIDNQTTTFVKLLQLSANGKDLVPSATSKGYYVRALITTQIQLVTTSTQASGLTQFVIQGYGGPAPIGLTNPTSGEADIVVERGPPTAAGTPFSIKSNFTLCGATCASSQYTGTQVTIGAPVAWSGATPDFKAHVPAAITLLGYFQPVIALQNGRLNYALDAIDPDVSGKNWWEFTQNDWNHINILTSAEGVEQQGTLKNAVTGLGASVVLYATLTASVFATPVGGAVVAAVGGFLVNEYNNYLGDMIVAQDAKFCADNPKREGCDSSAKSTVKE